MSSVGRYVVSHLVTLFPPTRAYALKARLWNIAGIKVSLSARLVSSASFHTSGDICIGERTFIGHEVMFVSGESDIVIGRDVDIAPRVLFAAGTHMIDMVASRSAGPGLSKPITVHDGVWIGANSTILGGVTIGKKAIVAAGSLVNRDVPPYSLVAGVPARVIKSWNEADGRPADAQEKRC